MCLLITFSIDAGISILTGSRPLVIHKYLWKIGFITGSVVVGFLLSLYGIKGNMYIKGLK